MPAGILYIIATPIGNLEDITFRAVRILKEETDVVFCEDTRQTQKLLSHYGIRAPLQSLHAHSSPRKIESVIALLQAGKTVSYVTDSGTPALSDPGSRLVSAARDAGISVSPVPGPSALAAIVSVSGYHGKKVVFSGFLSKKENRRRTELQSLKQLDGIIVLYESPYRIKKLLAAVNEVYPGRRVLIGREMTKLHEEFICAPIEELISSIDSIKEKGEFTVAIYNYEEDYVENEPED